MRQTPSFYNVLIIKPEHIHKSAQRADGSLGFTSAYSSIEWENRIQPHVMYKGKCDCSLINIQISYSANLEDA